MIPSTVDNRQNSSCTQDLPLTAQLWTRERTQQSVIDREMAASVSRSGTGAHNRCAQGG
jgi:hypothetical protein